MTEPRQYYCSRCLTTFPANPDRCTNMGCGRDRPERGWGEILSSGDVFDRNYKIHRMLAMGGAGVTYVARELDESGQEVGPEVAIKVLLAARDAGNYVRRLSTEAQIIQELDHPHIVRYLGFVHRTGRSPYLITRFEEGGCLLDHMRRVGTLSVLQTAVVGQQICRALVEAHRREIVHRDLKPENVLLESKLEADEDLVVRVADFGIAKIQGSLNSNLTRVGSFVGTPHFAAPEQFLGQPVTQASDIYSTGALLHFCMSAKHVCKDAHLVEPQTAHENLLECLPVTLPASAGRAEDVIRMQRILALAMDPVPERRLTAMELNLMCAELLAGRDPKSPERLRTGLGLGESVPQASHTMADESFSVLGASVSSSPVPENPTTRLDPVSTQDAPSGNDGASHEFASEEQESTDGRFHDVKETSNRGGVFAIALFILIGTGGALGWTFGDEIGVFLGMADETSSSQEVAEEVNDGDSSPARDDDEGAEDSVRPSDRKRSDRKKRRRERKREQDEPASKQGEEKSAPLFDFEGPETELRQDLMTDDLDESEDVSTDEPAASSLTDANQSEKDSTETRSLDVEQFVFTVKYQYRGSPSDFSPVAQEAAQKLASQRGWTYKGREGKPSLPTCEQGFCRGAFTGKFERAVVP